MGRIAPYLGKSCSYATELPKTLIATRCYTEL
jgi:hypothetical protein